jgi:hypothetical protein
MSARAIKAFAYNLDNHRDPEQVNAEVKALLNVGEDKDKRPAFLALCEAVGYDLPTPTGFHLVRDRSTPSRANIAAYVRNDLWGGAVKWFDLKHTWTRTNPGASGQHEPRSYVRFRVGTMPVFVVHQPPKQVDNAKAAQQEGIDLLVREMKPDSDASQDNRDRPRFAVGDFNRRKGEEGPGPDMLAGRISGKNECNKIDTVVRRGQGKVEDVTYPVKVGGVVLKSDHGHALRFVVSVPEKWWVPE